LPITSEPQIAAHRKAKKPLAMRLNDELTLRPLELTHAKKQGIVNPSVFPIVAS
jgi:hypothetical protein